jgi:hypothetical protein
MPLIYEREKHSSKTYLLITLSMKYIFEDQILIKTKLRCSILSTPILFLYNFVLIPTISMVHLNFILYT